MTDFSELLAKTLVRCERMPYGKPTFKAYEAWRTWARSFDSETLVFVCDDGTSYVMGYEQDCCASCEIESINGDLSDLVGVPIVLADEASSSEPDSDASPSGWTPGEWDSSYTWTFYRLATVKGHVDIRWFGSSNGYYSESVSFYKCDEIDL